MNKKLLIFAVIFTALLAAALVYNYFAEPAANTPATSSNGEFHGPIGAPSVNGPTSPPPKQ